MRGLARHSRWVELGWRRGRGAKVPPDDDRRLWRDHDVIRYAEPSPVKLYKVGSSNDWYDGGPVELFGHADPPSINDDFGLVRHHLDLKGGIGSRRLRRSV